MKKLIPFLILMATLPSVSWSQLSCEVDTAFVNSGVLVSPLPYVNDTLGEGITVEACINMPYEFDVLLHAPSEIPFGTFSIPIETIQIADVQGLPEGINFECSFPDCIVPGDSIACLRLSGTPTEANDTGSYFLFIKLSVPGLPLITFPDTTGLLGLPDGSYSIQLNAEGHSNCEVISSNRDLNVHVLQVFPNPTYDVLTVDWSANQSKQTALRIVSASGIVVRERYLGKSIGSRHEENIADLPPGFYLVGILSETGQTWRKVQKF